MATHEEKVARVVQQILAHKSTQPLSLRKKAVSHSVPNPRDKRYTDKKVDISDLNTILFIDPHQRTCVAEPGVTFYDLVTETLRYKLVPMVVPELKTITIGGAVAGCSIESMSYKYGGFHDSCLAYEIITAKGEVLLCSPTNENSLLFHMVHGAFGTLGIISLLHFKLVPAQPFVHVIYKKYHQLEHYLEAIWHHYQQQDIDFMDGIIHSPTELVLSVGNFVEEAPYTHNYDWMGIYYLSTKERKEDYLTTRDYFFRYEKGVTNVYPQSFLGRLLFGRFINSTTVLRFVEKFHRFIPNSMIPITIDTFIPFSQVRTFLDWYIREINHFPLWCVPYKRVHDYEWISPSFLGAIKDELFLDLAIYGMKKHPEKNYYRMIEEKLLEIGGLKTLISNNFYSENEFWHIWNKENYLKVKAQTDPNNIFRDLYTKTCKATRGQS